MSNTRYIEIDSTYRDRNRWPLSSEFEIPISQTGRKGRYDALDPVCLSEPIATWYSNQFDKLNSLPLVQVTVETPTPVEPIGFTNDNDIFIVEANQDELQHQLQYYVGAVADNTTLGEKRRIVTYEFIGFDSLTGKDRAAMVVSPSFSSAFNSGDVIVINDPTDLSNPNEPLIFVPSARPGSNSYISFILYNLTLNEYRKVKRSYDITNIIQLDSKDDPVVGWTSTDKYSIRLDPPLFFGKLDATTLTTVTLPVTASTRDNFYTKFFLRMISGVAEDETRLILGYDGSTRIITLCKPFDNLPVAGDCFEILQFSYDNAVPFVYSGSLVSQQEEVCYELELMNLILPNKTLNTAFGSRIAFYPYLYVELVNVSGASAGVKNIIYSNNPNSVRMLFRAAVDDTSNPRISPFVKIDGDGMVQTIKFKPNDTLKFSVRFSTGQLYETILPEFYSPSIPNPDAQISACFALKRL